MARTRAAGKRIGIYALSAARTRELIAEGFDLIALIAAGFARASRMA
jgi:4-hydroxy-2-oxoheptanedioate aldolase